MMTQSKNKSVLKFRPILVVIAISAALSGANLALSSPAYASDRDSYPAEQVDFRDLNLTSEAGVARLQMRIRRAARHVCGHDSSSLSPRRRLVRECVAAATQNGLSQAERKIALYRARSIATD